MNRPVIIIGNGCRGNPELVKRLCSFGVPVMTTWQSIDLVRENDYAFCGRPGTVGMRAANIIVQKSSNLYVFGAKLDAETVGWDINNFAPHADKIVIDVDEAELRKLPDDWTKERHDLSKTLGFTIESNPEWLTWCNSLYARFRPELEGNPSAYPVDPYYFISVLSDVLEGDAIIVPGSSGIQSNVLMQAFKVKRGQRILLCNTIGAMGMEPMAIGAAIASGKPVTVVTGDGGFGLNIQELEVVRREKLPIKYFVFSNGGYGSVVSMQDSRFGRRVGADRASGFTVPNLDGIADLFKMPIFHFEQSDDCENIADILTEPRPAIIEVRSSLEFKYACKMGSSLIDNKFVRDNLEDMTPHISDLAELMKWGMDD